MLQNQGAAVDADYFPVRKQCFYNPQGFLILRRLVDRYQNCTVEDQKIGVGSRQPVPIGREAGVGPGQRYKPVGFAGKGTERLQFAFHGLQGGKVFVMGLVAAYVGNGIGCAQARQCVNVRVGVVAGEISVMQPKHLLQPKQGF